jgi:hypothetical protein
MMCFFKITSMIIASHSDKNVVIYIDTDCAWAGTVGVPHAVVYTYNLTTSYNHNIFGTLWAIVFVFGSVLPG